MHPCSASSASEQMLTCQRPGLIESTTDCGKLSFWPGSSSTEKLNSVTFESIERVHSEEIRRLPNSTIHRTTANEADPLRIRGSRRILVFLRRHADDGDERVALIEAHDLHALRIAADDADIFGGDPLQLAAG